MFGNQQVRERLRNELQVQLSQSSVIDQRKEIDFGSRILDRENDEGSCDMSIIDQLGMLDRMEDSLRVNQALISRHDQKGFLQYDKIQDKKRRRNRISSYYCQQFSNNSEQPIHVKAIIRKQAETILPHKNEWVTNFSQQQNRNQTQRIFSQLFNDQRNMQLVDIEQKISILPYQLQQKIKKNLHHKINSTTQQQLAQSKFFKLRGNNQQKNSNQKQFRQRPELQHILSSLNNAVSFITPIKQRNFHHCQTSNQQNRFVSLDKAGILSRSRKKSILLKQNEIDMKNKYSTPHLLTNRQISRNKNQQSKSRSKHIMLHSLQLRRNSSNIMQTEQVKTYQQLPPKQYLLRQNLISLPDQFNKSNTIKHYTEILSEIPKCRKCSISYGALTLDNHTVTYACNQCDLRNKLQRSVSFLSSSSDDILNFITQKQSQHYNHPVIGALFDLENKLMNQQEMKTYNLLLKDIKSEISKIDELRMKLLKLQLQIEELKQMVMNNPKVIFEAKNTLKKIFAPHQLNQQTQPKHPPTTPTSISSLLPPQYLQQLDLWCKIKSKDFTIFPQIQQKLQLLCPLYMKRDIKTIKEFLNPLLHNFQKSEMKISVSEGLQLPVKSLGGANFVVDGPYNISPFQKIEKLSLQFVNKRTFRQITSVMESLPQIVQQINAVYNHKLNSHISAQKYPILTKLSSIRSCKKLSVTIQNCKDEDDLISAFKVMTKKKVLKINTTRSIYVRKQIIDLTQQIRDMLRRLGKNVYQVELKLAVGFNEQEVYKELMLNERNKLMRFQLVSTLVKDEDKSQHLQNRNIDDNLLSVYSSILNSYDSQKQQSCGEKIKKKINAKESFQNKIRKKLSTLALLKESFAEKELIHKYRDYSVTDTTLLTKRYHSSHFLRLQVLKMLL